MLFASIDFVFIDFSSKIFVHFPRFLEFSNPFITPSLMFIILHRGQLKNPDSFSSTTGTTSNYSAINARMPNIIFITKRTQKNITFSTNFEKPRSFEQAHTLAAILKSMCAPSKSRDIPKTLTKSSPFEVCRPS